jgi:pimeloyl-ACP methyl ester carboxylesterase
VLWHDADGCVSMKQDSRRTTIATSDGVALSVQILGRGEPVIFLHEFSGDLLSWAPQVETLSARYQCICFNARGYPPSQVPVSLDAYSQERAADDVADVMDALGVGSASIVGLSMGGFATLHVAIRHPTRARALVVAGCGYGAKPSDQAHHFTAMNREADHAESIGMPAYARELGDSPYAQPLRAKDEAAWHQFTRQLMAHSAQGMAMTLRSVLARRPSLWHLEPQLSRISQPVLLVIGDEDEPCIEPNLFLRRVLPDCALAVMPRTGHLINLEEPRNFNALIESYLGAVSDGSWNRIKASIRAKEIPEP